MQHQSIHQLWLNRTAWNGGFFSVLHLTALNVRKGDPDNFTIVPFASYESLINTAYQELILMPMQLIRALASIAGCKIKSGLSA